MGTESDYKQMLRGSDRESPGYMFTGDGPGQYALSSLSL